jgi:D-alanyl-D-alanine carboxypeptidase
VIGTGVLLVATAASIAVVPGVAPEPPLPTPPPSAPTTSSTTTSSPTTSTSTTSTSTTTVVLPPLPAVAPTSWARFDELVAGQLTGRGDRAASVAVSVTGRIVHAAGFGTRAPDDPLDVVTTTDRFRIASISKIVTATVVLQLVEFGALDLDQPVGQRLAALAGVAPGEGVAGVTVRQLLSHTAGFPKYRDQFFSDRLTSCEQAAAFALPRSLARAPGTRHEYSNLNYCLLGMLIADATGRPYEQAVNELLLRPLGIAGMRLVATFDPDPDEVVHVSGTARTYMEALGAAGGWVATPSDMVRILDALDPATAGWHPLSPALAMLMRTALDVSYPEPSERRYGLGIFVWPDGSWGHTGTVENTHTMLVRRPDGVTWCILVSGDVPESTERLREVFERAIGGAGIALT